MRIALALPAALVGLTLGVASAQEAPDRGPIQGRSGLDRPSSPAPEAPVPVSSPSGDTKAAPAPTLYPRLLPAADRHGDAFADRVSISPDGRRLAVGTQEGGRYTVQVVGVTRKATERTLRGRGRLDWVGWSDGATVLLGTREGSAARVSAYDVASGRARVLGSARDERSGVLTIRADGGVVLAGPERTAPGCANGAVPPAVHDDVPLTVAGPPDARGRLVLRGEAEGRSVLVPFDCEAGTLGEPLYEGDAAEGLIVNPALRRYEGVWTPDGPRYFDRSLAFEMREVAASFPEPVDVYPIETTRSPNTMLLYVVGDTVPGGYYVLDRYAGDLDLHVTYRQDGAAQTSQTTSQSPDQTPN